MTGLASGQIGNGERKLTICLRDIFPEGGGRGGGEKKKKLPRTRESRLGQGFGVAGPFL